MPPKFQTRSIGRQTLFNIIALITVAVWGVTFISTKVLISSGLTPTWIFITRFAIAYLCILTISHRQLWAGSLKDELLMAAMGLTGGSLYFISENTALQFTYASNVSLIICATPILTMALDLLVYKNKVQLRAIIGSLIALCGVTIVILNGSLNLGLNPKGDFLTLLAAFFWAAYCMLLKKLNTRYSNLLITRKVFFYGFASALLLCFSEPAPEIPAGDTLIQVVLNLLFLGVVASFLCYIMWNNAVKILGPDKTANYIYFTPLITILASAAILEEPVTLWMLFGGAAIIGGVYLSAKQ